MKKIVMVMIGFLLMGLNLYAADGDFIVDGNLGVGTTSLTERVEISSDNAGGTNRLKLQNANSTDGNSHAELMVRTNGSGSGDAKVHLTNGLVSWLQYLDNSDSDKLKISYEGSDKITVDSSGSVGIGTTSPGAKLHVAGGDIKLDSGKGVYFGNGTVNNGIIGSDTYDTITFRVWAQDKMIIKGSEGYVGIGTINPTQKLYVAGNIYATGTITPSDAKFKTNISPIGSALTTVIKLHGVSYNWKTEEFKDKGFSEGKHYGVIAQEIEKVLPEIVTQGHDGDKAVAYNELIPILIEAVKEQQKEIDTLKLKQASMEQQQALISVLYEKVNAMEKQIKLQGTVALTNY